MSEDFAVLSERHLEAYRLACRENRKKDALREIRLHTTALSAARAISTYQHELGKQ